VLRLEDRLLKRGLEICGGSRALCLRLGVSDHALLLWVDGMAQLPQRAFKQLADIVLEDDVARAATDRRKCAR
jgi:DNA-binding transcriptional regulator YdaS (Cro superfamily)